MVSVQTGEQTAGVTLRWSRAAVLASAALGFAGAAHVVAGGRLPGAVALSLIMVATTGWLASQLGRPASTLRVVLLLAGGQALLHAMFTAAGGHADAGAETDATPASLVWLLEGSNPIQVGLHHLAYLSTTAHLRMAAAHLVGAATGTVVSAPTAKPPATHDRPPQHTVLLARAVVRRGPPGLAR